MIQKLKNISIIFTILIININLNGQNKKLYWGFSFYQNFSSIKNNDSIKYFRKPSVGIGFNSEYYISKNFGIGLGFNFMQRGAGVKLIDVDKSLGNADSTNRLRLRFNTLDLPVQLFYKIPLKNTNKKIHLGIGITPVYNFETNQIMHSVEDGFHLINGRSYDFYKFDMEFNGSLGLDIINSGNTTFQLHLVLSKGTNNIYSNNHTFATKYNATSNYFGIKLSCLY